MQETISFHWRHEWITPRLTMAVGSVVLKWAMIDTDFTSGMCRPFWFKENSLTVRMPQSFKARATNLSRSVAKLYSDEPDEFRQFSWYLHRLRIAASKRDDLAHGKPGMVTIAGREFEGLLVEHPSGAPKGVQMSALDIEALAEDIRNLHTEMHAVAMALHVAAQVATLRAMPNPPTLGGLLPSTTGPRSPMMPQWNRPPPTFRV